MPTQPAELTPEFLSELVGELRPGSAVESTRIVKVRNYGEADNLNSVSTSTQITLDVNYGHGSSPGLPSRLLGKMSIPGGVKCSNPELDPLFRNEIAFYGRLRPELDIETPLGLGGRFEELSKRFVLLMEDLSPRSPHINSMMDDDDVVVVEALLDTLAKLHARYWRSPRFDSDLGWVENQIEGSIEDMFDGAVRQHVVKELRREKVKREFMQETRVSESQLSAPKQLTRITTRAVWLPKSAD
jgi:hypothetical protein